ncbi:MAG TPA: hypothetical protein VGW10_10310 [Solirubrobacteraceae bacterium]|nr:hypothetical protein [Solirubrobacteraceae bacterium]
MGYAIAVAVSVVVLIGAFSLGRSTGNRRWAFLPAILPVGFLLWALVASATEDKSECYDTCGSTWLYAFSVVAVVPALVLAGAVLIGVASGRGERPRTQRASGPAAT